MDDTPHRRQQLALAMTALAATNAAAWTWLTLAASRLSGIEVGRATYLAIAVAAAGSVPVAAVVTRSTRTGGH